MLILPKLFPALNGGEGLLKETDALHFHVLAKATSESISDRGLYVLRELPVKDRIPHLVTLIYFLTSAHPWVLAPFFALLHALGTAVLMRILLFFTTDWKKALLGSLPFWLFPSAMAWYAQIHRDGIHALGFYLFLLGWLFLLQLRHRETSGYTLMKGILCLCLGVLLIALSRPYMVQVLVNLIPIPLVLLCVLFIRQWRNKKLSTRKMVYCLALLLLFPITLKPLLAPGMETKIAPIRQTEDLTKRGIDLSDKWIKSRFLPPAIDGRFHSISNRRDGFRNYSSQAGSAIDMQIKFTKAWDVIEYIPRAIQVAFLSPFPSQLNSKGHRPESKIVRSVASVETLLVYTFLVLFLLALRTLVRKPEFWVVFSFCLPLLLLGALTINNIGTLYRIRYPYLMVCVGLGLAMSKIRINEMHYKIWLLRKT